MEAQEQRIEEARVSLGDGIACQIDERHEAAVLLEVFAEHLEGKAREKVERFAQQLSGDHTGERIRADEALDAVRRGSGPALGPELRAFSDPCEPVAGR